MNGIFREYLATIVGKPMSDACFKILITDACTQSNVDESFVGGLPRLPASIELPKCELCGNYQSFYFQLKFPAEIWDDRTLAVFACTSCFDENWLIPEMLSPVKGAIVTGEFLKNSQRNFRFIVFDSRDSVLRLDYKPRVLYKKIELIGCNPIAVNTDKVGGKPNWILEDESPSSFKGSGPMKFLIQVLQVKRPAIFEISADSPRQMTFDFFTNTPVRSTKNSYMLFNGNNLYLFGVVKDKLPQVYCVTQV